LIRVAVWLGHVLIVVAAVLAAIHALGVLTGSAPPVHVALPRLFPFVAMSLSVDGLSAFFLLVVALVTAAAALYAPSYLGAHAKAPGVQEARARVLLAPGVAHDEDPARERHALPGEGFGAKAGVVPLHVWLPKAHPAAPSHASALMSGVMLKVALYGIFRWRPTPAATSTRG
jgi:formate hydrogenlyase subunit 3/multisubunit Na+/H+ antiporter MnhD subunit